MRISAREIVAAFGGGDILPDGNVVVAAPGHSRRDRSMSILPLPDGRIVVNTFSPRDDRLTLLRYAEDRLGITRRPAPVAKTSQPAKARLHRQHRHSIRCRYGTPALIRPARRLKPICRAAAS